MKKTWKFLTLGATALLPLCAVVSCHKTEQKDPNKLNQKMDLYEKSELNDNLSKIEGIDELIKINPSKHFDLQGLNVAVKKYLKGLDSHTASNFKKSIQSIIKVINAHSNTFNKNQEVNKDSWVALSLVNTYISYLNTDVQNANGVVKDKISSDYIGIPEPKIITHSLYSEMSPVFNEAKLFKSVDKEKSIKIVDQILSKKNSINWDTYAKIHKDMINNNLVYGLDIVKSLDLSELQKSQTTNGKLLDGWAAEDTFMKENINGYNALKFNGLNSVWNNMAEYLGKSKNPEFVAPLSYLNKEGKTVDAISDYTIQEVSFEKGNNLAELMKLKDLPTIIANEINAVKNSIIATTDLEYFFGDNYDKFDYDINKIKNIDFNKTLKFYKITIPVYVSNLYETPRVYKVYGEDNKLFINYMPAKRAQDDKRELFETFDAYVSHFKNTYEKQFERFSNNKKATVEAYSKALYNDLTTNQLSKEALYEASTTPLKQFEFIVPFIASDQAPEIYFNALDDKSFSQLEYKFIKLQLSKKSWPDHKANPYTGFDKLQNKYGDIKQQPYSMAILHNTTNPQIAQLLNEKGL
ncbi:hypothetical protein [Mycoplasma sp. 005V]|uniref:hypothetical protein n=1 Tax=unclassified Mycoplasma TaxID=2683645 RepID=UPI003A871A78